MRPGIMPARVKRQEGAPPPRPNNNGAIPCFLRRKEENSPKCSFSSFGQGSVWGEEMIQEIAFPVILLLPQRSSVLLFVLLFVCDAAVQSQSRKFAAIPLLLCLSLPPTHFFVSPPLSAALE